MSLAAVVAPELLPAVSAAVRAAAGDAPIEAAERLHGGLSGAPTLRVVAGGASYVVRALDPRAADPANPPGRWLHCLRAAADAGIAPPLVHVSADGLVTVSRLVETRPLPEAERPALPRRLGELARALHALPGFPPFVRILDFVAGLTAATRGLAAAPPPVRRFAERVEALLPLLRRHPDEAACHNDLNPGNFLWDGERFWLVDWDAAGRGDPFHDLATLALWFRVPAGALLEAWRGGPPSPRDRAKLVAMQAVSLGFYGLQPLRMALAAGFRPPAGAADAPVPTFDDWLRGAGGHVEEGSRGALAKVWELGLVAVHEGLRRLDAPELAEAAAQL